MELITYFQKSEHHRISDRFGCVVAVWGKTPAEARQVYVDQLEQMPDEGLVYTMVAFDRKTPNDSYMARYLADEILIVLTNPQNQGDHALAEMIRILRNPFHACPTVKELLARIDRSNPVEPSVNPVNLHYDIPPPTSSTYTIKSSISSIEFDEPLGAESFSYSSIEFDEPLEAVNILETAAEAMLVIEEGPSVAQYGYDGYCDDILSYFIEKDINFRRHGFTALCYAAKKGHYKVAKHLIEHGASLTIKNCHGWTPLSLAAYNGHSICVELMLQHDLTLVNCVDAEGNTPLILASINDQRHVVELLLKKTNNNAESCNKKGVTALMVAAQHGHSEIIELLMEHDQNLNATDRIGMSAVMWASFHGHKGCIEKLTTSQNCNLLLRDKIHQNTCIHFALEKRFFDLASLLFKANPDVVIGVNKLGRTPLMTACASSSLVEFGRAKSLIEQILEASLAKGLSLTKTDILGLNALSLSCLHGNYIATQLLLEAKCDPNLRDGATGTPLIYAAKGNSVESAKILLATGTVNLNYQDEYGRTALMYSAEMGHGEIASILIEKGANLLLQDSRDHTALTLAIMRQDPTIITKMLSKDNNQKKLLNSLGETPYEIAERLDCSEDIIQALKN